MQKTEHKSSVAAERRAEGSATTERGRSGNRRESEGALRCKIRESAVESRIFCEVTAKCFSCAVEHSCKAAAECEVAAGNEWSTSAQAARWDQSRRGERMNVGHVRGLVIRKQQVGESKGS